MQTWQAKMFITYKLAKLSFVHLQYYKYTRIRIFRLLNLVFLLPGNVTATADWSLFPLPGTPKDYNTSTKHPDPLVTIQCSPLHHHRLRLHARTSLNPRTSAHLTTTHPTSRPSVMKWMKSSWKKCVVEFMKNVRKVKMLPLGKNLTVNHDRMQPFALWVRRFQLI